jgi:hypothetical protein
MFGMRNLANRMPALVLLVAVGSVACGDDTPAGPASGLARVSFDFSGDGTLAPDPGAGLRNCTLPDGQVATALPDAFVADQSYTLLGRTHGDISVASCRIDPATGEMTLEGAVVHTGEQGDVLMADYELVLAPDGTFVLDAVVTGGTGELEGAGGEVSGPGTLDLATGAGQFSLSGVITLPR